MVRRIREQDLGNIMICEPNLERHDELELTTLDDALHVADIVVLLVNHREFRSLGQSQFNDKIVSKPATV